MRGFAFAAAFVLIAAFFVAAAGPAEGKVRSRQLNSKVSMLQSVGLGRMTRQNGRGRSADGVAPSASTRPRKETGK